jgi:methionine aminopeptidase
MAFQVPYIFDYITKLCRHQVEVIQNHENANVRDFGKTKPDTENIRGLSLAAVKRTTVQVTRQSL